MSEENETADLTDEAPIDALEKCRAAFTALGLALDDVALLTAEEQQAVAAMPEGESLGKAFDAFLTARRNDAELLKAGVDDPRRIALAKVKRDRTIAVRRGLRAATRGLLVALALCCSLPALAVDLTITAANVKVGDNDAKATRVQFGEAVTQGQAVYQKATDRKFYKADADAADAEADNASAIVLTPATTDGYGYVVTEGNLVIGATLTVGEIYVLSDTAGGVRPEADNGTADRVTILGVATSSTVLLLNPFVTNAVIP